MNENKKTEKRIIPGFIANDFWRKLIALFFAVLVWGRVASKLNEDQKIREIPVKISVPEEYVIIGNRVPTVDLVLKGSRHRLNKITPSDIEINCTLTHPVAGINSIILSDKNISIPKGITVKEITPSSVIKVQVDRKLVKKVPVKLKYSGSLLDGYASNPTYIIPSEVTISGPLKEVEKINSVNTENIVLKKENVEDFECIVKLKKPVNNITVVPEEISAKIEIYRKFGKRTFTNIPVKPFGYTPDGMKLRITPPYAEVTVEGIKKAVETVTAGQICPCVDISNIEKPGEYTLNVQCWLKNSELSVRAIKPKTVNITLTEE